MFKQARRMELSKAYIHTPFLASIWWLVLGPLCLTFSMLVVGFLAQDPAKEEVSNGDVKEKETKKHNSPNETLQQCYLHCRGGMACSERRMMNSPGL